MVRRMRRVLKRLERLNEDTASTRKTLYSRATEAEAMQAKVPTADEAKRIAINIARLPELLGKAD